MTGFGASVGPLESLPDVRWSGAATSSFEEAQRKRWNPITKVRTEHAVTFPEDGPWMPTCPTCEYRPHRGRRTRKLAKDWLWVHKKFYCQKGAKI